MKNKFYFLVILMAFSAILFYKCDKTDELNIEPQSAKDFAIAEGQISSIFQTIISALQDTTNHLNKKVLDDAPVITIIPAAKDSFPKSITIYYDTINGCSIDGRLFKGIIKADISKPYKTSGSVINVDYNKFYIDEYCITGNKVFTNLGTNGSGKLQFKIEVKPSTIVYNSGTISYSADKTITWEAGSETESNITDDVFLVDVNSVEGTNVNNKHYTANTSTTIRIEMNCKHKIVSGILLIKPDDAKQITLNYGNGTCDNKAVLSMEGLDDISISF